MPDLTVPTYVQITIGGEEALFQRSSRDVAHTTFDHSNETAEAAYIGDGTLGVTGVSSKAIYLHIASAYRWFLYWGFVDVRDPNLHIGAFRDLGHAPNDDRLVRQAPAPGQARSNQAITISPPTPLVEASRPVTLQDLESLLQSLAIRSSPSTSPSSPSSALPNRPAPSLVCGRAQLLVAAHRSDPEARPMSTQQAELIELVCNPTLSRDVLVALRPSGGKTLAFEIAGRLRSVGTILFMVPLKSIAIDLVARMSAASVQSEFWSPTSLPSGGIIFIALEEAGSMSLHEWLRRYQTRIHCIVLDEVHGAAVDGYRSNAWAHIHKLRRMTHSSQQRVVPLIGLSGSLSPEILAYTIQHFQFDDPVIIRGPLNIPHISFSFHPIHVDEQDSVTREQLFTSQIIYNLTQAEKNRLKSAYPSSRGATSTCPRPTLQTLVLFASVAQVDAAFLAMPTESKIRRYHSQVDPTEQQESLSAVRDGSCVILLATSGAATGLDAAFTQVNT